LLNSRPSHFSAAFSSSFCESYHRRRHPFFRSYGVKLPSSLTRVISIALGFSPYLPVSVYGTVTQKTPYEVFPVSVGSTSLQRFRFLITSQGSVPTDLPAGTPYRLESGIPSPDWSTLLRYPFGKTPSERYSNINEFPISFAFRLRLRGRLTLGGLTFPRKPQVFGVPISYRNYRYSCRHIHFYSVHPDSRLRLLSE
jgi:hypothetical protein